MTRCDSCDIELNTDPLVVRGRAFCCEGCSEGGPCACTYEKENSRHPRNGHSDPVVSDMLLRATNPDYDVSRDHRREGAG